MRNGWKKWELSYEYAGEYSLHSINIQEGRDALLLKDINDSKKIISVHFSGRFYGYRKLNQNYKNMVVNSLKEQGLIISFPYTWAFYKAYSSEYLEWLSFQSGELSDYLEFVHFVVICTDCVIEFVDLEDIPKVNFLN